MSGTLQIPFQEYRNIFRDSGTLGALLLEKLGPLLSPGPYCTSANVFFFCSCTRVGNFYGPGTSRFELTAPNVGVLSNVRGKERV